MATETQSYKDLRVWQLSVELAVAVYDLTDLFPKSELFGLTSQMRRAAVSIPSNIAEGRMRGTRKDYTHFLRIAYGSCAELATQIIISKRRPFSKILDYKIVDELQISAIKMLGVMISKMDLKP